MTYGDDLLPEFDAEMATTRRLLERVPTDKGTWKPHPKSFPLGHLAQLVSNMPGWITQILQENTLDLSSGSQYTYETTDVLVDKFDRNVAGARDAINSATDDDVAKEWSLTMGDKVLFTDSRRAVVRQTINHLIHHRGQLTVYLRENDVPIPSIYGPTADEPWGAPPS